MPAHALKDMHLYIDTPEPIFKARVNMASITYPVTALTFDTVTLGAFGDVITDMTLLLGTADGLDDLGRTRVQAPATSSTIPVGRISQGVEDGTLTVTDNAYITVLEDFRVWARIPYESPDGIAYKDADYAVGDFMTEIPPVANCGPGFADYINSGTSVITVTFDGTDSFAMADGAVISTFAWDVQDGTITVGTSADDTITATFPAGFRWVALTVTDDNGKSHTARCPVLAVNPAADVTIPFSIANLTIEGKGQILTINLIDERLRTTYPDGALVMFWWDTPSSASDRTHMRFIGWHQSDTLSLRATETGLVRETTLTCLDVAGRLATLPAFPQALERNASEQYWAYMPTLTLRKAVHYLLYWHSTALALADLELPDVLEDDYPSMRLDSTGGNLYDQIDSRAASAVPDYHLTCDIQGRLHVLPDWMLLEEDDRPSSPAGTLTEAFWSDIRVSYNRPPKIYALRSSAIVASTGWLVLGGQNTLPLAFCIAPGEAFGQGVAEQITGEKLTPSQLVLNQCEGQRYARVNARYGLFDIIEPSGDIDTYQPALMEYVQLNISAASAAFRGMDFTQARGMVKRIAMRFTTTEMGTWIQPTISWEKETFGVPAVTVIPEAAENPPDYETPTPPPPTEPPDMGLVEGVQQVAGIGIDGFVYRTSDFQTVSGSGGPTWDRVDTTIADTIYSFVVDPFSPGYINGTGTGTVNGWIVNDTAIYRVTDLFGSVAASSVHTFATATVPADYHWRTIQASFGAFFPSNNPWLLCVSYYGDTTGHTGTWATYSTDGGATWATEVQVSAHYDNGVASRFNPIGVYTSPRTPGLAYTAAYTETANPALADGYVSTDWGATWARVSPGTGDSPSEPLPMWAVLIGSTSTVIGLGATGTQTSLSSVVSGDPSASDIRQFYIAPDATTKRLEVDVYWDGYGSRTNGGSSVGSGLTASKHATVTQTGTPNYVQPTTPPVGEASTSGSFHMKWEFAGGDWPVNRGNVESSPPTSLGELGCRIQMNSNANATGVGNTAIGRSRCYVVITEIELDNGTIYTPPLYGAGAIQPGNAHAGSIYLPWNANATESLIYFGYLDRLSTREFSLKQSLGGTITDISPTESAVTYGVGGYGFPIRAYDNDRTYMAFAGRGNSTSADPADDLVGLFVSDDTGSTWANILTPVSEAQVAYGLEIAFGSANSDVLFAWGAYSNAATAAIYYSSDFGTTLDSREGNINSLGTTAFIGLAGGPTGA